MIAMKSGDRRTLTFDEIKILDGKVIPTARRWLREQPRLAHHAVTTLTHWNEPLFDDTGKAYQTTTNKENTP